MRERRVRERRQRRLVSRVLYPVRAVIICLGLTLPAASSDLPESLAKRAASPLLFGLSPGGVYQAAAVAGGTGELLPRLFTLTSETGGGVFSVALSLGSPPLGVTQHPALWSPDFPRALARRDHPVYSAAVRRYRTPARLEYSTGAGRGKEKTPPALSSHETELNEIAAKARRGAG